MLKKICRLFLGLVVCAGSACVTPTHASSASPILLTAIQAAGPGGAKEEFVSFYNTSSSDQDITGWCLQNKAGVKFACIGDAESPTRVMLAASGSAVVVSVEYIAGTGLDPLHFSKVFSVTNQSSGSLVASSDSVTLLNSSGSTVDSFSWSTSAPTSKMWARSQAGAGHGGFASTGLPSDWQAIAIALAPGDETYERIADTPSEPEPEDPPESGESEGGATATLQPQLSEILPNPEGSDIGREFIELYNPNESSDVVLDGYILRVGPSLEKSYTFPAGSIIRAQSYQAFSSEQMGFTLVNSTSSVQLVYRDGSTTNTVTYEDPADGQPWALVGEAWKYLASSTPGQPNDAPEVPINDTSSGGEVDYLIGVKSGATSALKPCAANQYRSAETNRCRLIQPASSSVPAPCKQGQIRSAETGRCRAIASTSTDPAPCKEGQERNPETNRCRNIVKMTDANHAVMGVSVQKANVGVSLYTWLAIAGVVALVVGYAVWEWRQEIGALLKRIRQTFLRSST